MAALAAHAVEVDGIAARVGSSVILKSDVVGEMRRAGVGPDRYAMVRGEMIERELMLKAAAAAKLQMQDWVVENRIREIVTRVFGGDMNKFKAALAKDRVNFKLEGPGEIVAVGNGSHSGLDSFAETSSHPLYYGRALVIVRRTGSSGLPLKLTASASSVRSATVTIGRK